MNKMIAIVAGGALMCAATCAMAQDGMKSDAMKSDGMHSKMSAMDANGDGMISKDEYMNHYKSEWENMPKNKDGMVMMKDMHKMGHDKMMSGHDAMIKGKNLESDQAKQDEVKKMGDGGH